MSSFRVGDFVKMRDIEHNRLNPYYNPYIHAVGLVIAVDAGCIKTNFCPSEMLEYRVEHASPRAAITDKQYEKLYE